MNASNHNSNNIPATVGGLLDEVESKLGRLGVTSKNTSLEIFHDMDQIASRLEKLKTQGSDIKSELAQYEMVSAGVKKQAKGIVRDAGGVNGLQKLRDQEKPAADHWWWYLDEYVVQQRKLNLVRAARSTGIFLIVLLALVLVYRLFFQPDPKLIATLDAQHNAEELGASGKYEEALTSVEKGLAVSPEDPELVVLRGVILELMQKPDDAILAYENAKKVFPVPADFYLTRGQEYITFGKYELGLSDGQIAVKENPKSAQGYILMGTSQELMGKTTEAINNYQIASEVATANDETSLAATAKIKLAMLMQRGGGMDLPGTSDETATPAP